MTYTDRDLNAFWTPNDSVAFKLFRERMDTGEASQAWMDRFRTPEQVKAIGQRVVLARKLLLGAMGKLPDFPKLGTLDRSKKILAIQNRFRVIKRFFDRFKMLLELWQVAGCLHGGEERTYEHLGLIMKMPSYRRFDKIWNRLYKMSPRGRAKQKAYRESRKQAAQ